MPVEEAEARLRPYLSDEELRVFCKWRTGAGIVDSAAAMSGPRQLLDELLGEMVMDMLTMGIFPEGERRTMTALSKSLPASWDVSAEEHLMSRI